VKTNSVRQNHAFCSAPLSIAKATISCFVRNRVQLFLFAMLLSACGCASAQSPFVIHGSKNIFCPLSTAVKK
jgi:hypothetical protein